MKNKVQKNREVKKLNFKVIKVSKVDQSKIVGGGWEDYWSYVFCM
ncbi:hypothetical protein IMCC3317_30320 [Kordia antarctica]|uniref:Uncharacterized protein n=1 Tax=Kordia antarctica TaxID=1218801 RepID=A0A7L4ZM95_9FLAO|nr:hypothetical protein [Kordia antarctica]QHI37651.1 hypothetical protein IMCC3317_30320 [Kordia antarctica]